MKKTAIITMMILILLAACAFSACSAEGAAEPAAPEANEETAAEAAEAGAEEGEVWGGLPVQITYVEDGEKFAFSANTITGEAIDESFFANADVTMINFWATYCGPCLYEMPDLGEIAEKYKDRGFQILGVVCDASDGDEKMLAEATDLVEQTGANYTHITVNDKLINDYLRSIYAVPTTVFVDSEGKFLCEYIVGSSTGPSWEKAIEDVLAR